MIVAQHSDHTKQRWCDSLYDILDVIVTSLAKSQARVLKKKKKQSERQFNGMRHLECSEVKEGLAFSLGTLDGEVQMTPKYGM